jgi:pSer/pThr/pTyr-binding forkhead associated (FHA) protein
MVVKLVVASGKSAGRAIAIKRNKLLIGRAEECDVRPLSEEVSRRHCAIVVGPSDVWVEDLGSRNGTFVNGTQIAEKTRVTDGDLVRIGSLELRVSVTDPAARAGTDTDVSRWLVGDEPTNGDGVATQTAPLDTATPPVAQTPAAASPPAVSPEAPAEAEPAAGGSDIIPTDDATGDTSKTTLEALKAARTKPTALPKNAAKKADSSRDAAAEALRKFFGNR